MDPVTQDSEFVEPVARPPRSEASLVASTSRVTLSAQALETTAAEPRSELSSKAGPSAPAPPEDTPVDKPLSDVSPTDEPSASIQTPSASSTPTKSKIFLKRTSPDVPLHIHLPRELSHSLTRKLQITIRAHGGVMESRFGKADLIVVDPELFGVSKRLLRDANKMGQPIPVVTLDYIQDSVSQGQALDVHDPKYSFDGTRPNPAPIAGASSSVRPLNGRNPFTEKDRQAIVSYFIDKPESSWSLNAAAKELAARIPSHSSTSFQSYLQANFEKGWNLKEQVLKDRRAALDAAPSELQARILRSQYTASPGLAEQSAPSDGWPRDSPRLHDEIPDRSSHQNETEGTSADEQASIAEEEEELAVRQPNPGSALQDIERSPTKVKQTVDYASSERSSPGTSPSPPESPLASMEPPPGQGSHFPGSPPLEEESDPGDFSPQILDQIERGKNSRSGLADQSQPKQRQIRHSSDSSEDSELDQLDQDSDEDMLTTGQAGESKEFARQRAASEDSEWEGSRRQDRKMQEKNPTLSNRGDNRVKFTQPEKDKLLKELADYVHRQGREPHPSTQEALLAKPDDTFWEHFATDNPTHSAMSWRSHYLKNRGPYGQMIKLLLEDMEDESDDDAEEADTESASASHHEDDRQNDSSQERRQQVSRNDRPSASKDDPNEAADLILRPDAASKEPDDISLPDDGIVVMIPRMSIDNDYHHCPSKVQTSAEQQWAEAPSPPPMEDEKEDMIQVEAEIDAIADAPALARSGSEGASISAEEESQEELQESLPNAHMVIDEVAEGSEGEASVIDFVAVREDVATSAVLTPKQPHRPVDAGTPVLAQHRDAPFYDFTMDSDEEERIRKARSRPSLPNMQPRREGTSSKVSRSPITTDRVLGHFATPSRSHKQANAPAVLPPGRQRHDERIERTREWARSVSRSPSAAPLDPFTSVEAVAVTESTRPRARRIDHRHLLSPGKATNLSPLLQQSIAQQTRRSSDGRGSAAIPHATVSTTQTRQARDGIPHGQRTPRSDVEAARLQYRAEVERFRDDFGLNKEQLRSLLMRFRASVKDARNYISFWLAEMEARYGVEAEVAFEYVKTSQGDFDQAETFLKLASMTRSSSVRNRLGGTSSRSASHSISPVKRSARDDERSFHRIDRHAVRADSSKRYRT